MAKPTIAKRVKLVKMIIPVGGNNGKNVKTGRAENLYNW